MSEMEWQTRKLRIDARLKASNPPWRLVRYREDLDSTVLDGVAVEEFPTENGPADYGLFVGGKWLGIIEAKKVGTGPQNVLEQARRYARGASPGSGHWRDIRVPFPANADTAASVVRAAGSRAPCGRALCAGRPD